jgi:hypothetical protein
LEYLSLSLSLSLSQKPKIFKTQNYRMHIVLRFFKNPRTFLAPEQEEDKEALEASKRIWTPVGNPAIKQETRGSDEEHQKQSLP